jgi:hypothetical protein
VENISGKTNPTRVTPTPLEIDPKRIGVMSKLNTECFHKAPVKYRPSLDRLLLGKLSGPQQWDDHLLLYAVSFWKWTGPPIYWYLHYYGTSRSRTLLHDTMSSPSEIPVLSASSIGSSI